MRIFRSHPISVTLSALLLLVAVLLVILQNPTFLDDSLRHFAMARLLREEGIVAVQGWSKFFSYGVLQDLHTDPWFLSDILFIPFTLLPPLLALDLFTFLCVAVVALSFLLLLRHLQLQPLPQAFLLLLLFTELQFFMRLLLGRPFSLVTALSLVLVWALLERRYILSGFLLAFATLLSQLFLFPLLLALLRIPWLLRGQRIREGGRLMLGITLGIGGGFAMHPLPLQYLSYLVTVFLRIPFLKGQVEESGEMGLGLSSFSLRVLALLAPILVLLAIGLHRRTINVRRDGDLWYLVSVSLLFLGLYLFWLRAIDFLWPLLCFLLAMLYAKSRVEAHAFFRSLSFPRWLGMLVIGVVIVHILVVPRAYLRTDDDRSLSEFASLSLLSPGSRVLNLDWQPFPVYVFLRPDLSYATGIDDAFTYLAHPEVTLLLQALQPDRVVYSLPQDIHASLQSLLRIYPSDFLVLLRERNARVIEVVASMPELSLVSNTGAIAIFRIYDSLHLIP